MDGPPTANLEVVEAQFVFLLPEALFNGPAGIGHIHRPFQGNTGRRVRNEELQFAALRIPRDDQPVGPGGQFVTSHEEPDRLDLADDGAFLAVLDMDGCPGLTLKRRGVTQQVPHFAHRRCRRRKPWKPAFPALAKDLLRRRSVENDRLLRPPAKRTRHFGHIRLTESIQSVQKVVTLPVVLIKRSRSHANPVAQRPLERRA